MKSFLCSNIHPFLVLLAKGEAPNLSKRLSWHDREGVVPSEIPPFPMYTSIERQTALLLCGWSFVADGQNLEDYIKRWVGSGGRGERREGRAGGVKVKDCGDGLKDGGVTIF